MRTTVAPFLVVSVAFSVLAVSGGAEPVKPASAQKPAISSPAKSPAAPAPAKSVAAAKPAPPPAPAATKVVAPPAPKSPPPASPASPAPPAAKLVALAVEPVKFVLDGKWSSQSLLVTGRLSDGSVRDFSGIADFRSANGKIAEVSKEGTVRPVGDGETAIAVLAQAGDSKLAAEVRATVTGAAHDSVYFLRDVMPLVSKLGCNQSACHGTLSGKGGFRLSIFGTDPEDDYAAFTKLAGARALNRIEPWKSLFLLEATGSIPHGGGQRLAPGSPEYRMLLTWITQGAPWAKEKEAKLVSIKVSPEQQSLPRGGTRQLLATAVFSDGSRKDVTRVAEYRPTDAAVAGVDGGGKVRAENFGQSAVVVAYLRQFALARIVVPQPLPGPFPEVKPNNKIDELVLAKLKELGIPPSEPCTDEAFVRRVYLDAIGVLPTVDEARALLADKDPQKRAKLVDRLLDRPEFADFWALKWGDLFRIKSEYPVRVWPLAVQAYSRWVHDSIQQNKPFDQFVRELLVSGGSNFRDPPCNFYRAVTNKDAQTFGETVGLLFMGVRLNCARCHGHPSETWTLDDNLGMAAFFTKVAFKATNEWKEEIVLFNRYGAVGHPRKREGVKPKFLGGETLPELPQEEDPRVKFADWLTSPQNPWFARNVVNRVWFWLLGRGIVNEPDDMRLTNPPENPALLDFLAEDLRGHKYDLKHIYRLILNSKIYQLSSQPNPWNGTDAVHFSHYPRKRLGAEQLLDMISQVTDTQEGFASWIPVPYLRLPNGTRAAQIPDGAIESPFLETFGRPPRDTPYECDRNLDATVRQALYRVSSDHLEGKVAGSQRVQRLCQANKSDADVAEEIYLATLARFPREDEKKKVIEYLVKNKAARVQAVQDLVWAVLNTKESMFNH
jgi:hypothetical protein